MAEPILKEIVDYISDEYSAEGADRLSRVKMVAHLSLMKDPPANWKHLIDKVALFNGIKKVKP